MPPPLSNHISKSLVVVSCTKTGISKISPGTFSAAPMVHCSMRIPWPLHAEAPSMRSRSIKRPEETLCAPVLCFTALRPPYAHPVALPIVSAAYPFRGCLCASRTLCTHTSRKSGGYGPGRGGEDVGHMTYPFPSRHPLFFRYPPVSSPLSPATGLPPRPSAPGSRPFNCPAARLSLIAFSPHCPLLH